MLQVTVKRKVGSTWETVEFPKRLSEQIAALKAAIDNDYAIEVVTFDGSKMFIYGSETIGKSMKEKFSAKSIIMDAMSAHHLLEYCPMLFIDIIRNFVCKQDFAHYMDNYVVPTLAAKKGDIKKWW